MMGLYAYAHFLAEPVDIGTGTADPGLALLCTFSAAAIILALEITADLGLIEVVS